MSVDAAVRGVLVALAVLNVAVTVYHARLVRRAAVRHRELDVQHEEMTRILGCARTLLVEDHARVGETNGVRRAEPEAGA